jgi:hypothetical protein
LRHIAHHDISPFTKGRSSTSKLPGNLNRYAIYSNSFYKFTCSEW